MKIKKHARATIDGALLVASDYDTKKGEKAKLKLDGQLSVNGLLTLIGSKTELKLKKKSDVDINGMFQIGIHQDHKKSEMKLEFDGDLEVHKDDEEIRKGAEALAALETSLDLSEIQQILSTKVVSYGWHPVTP